MRGVRLIITAVAGALALAFAVGAVAGPSPAIVAVRSQSLDTTYATKASRGGVTLWLHPRWRDSVLEVRMVVFSHSVHVTRARLEEGTRLVLNGVEYAPAWVGPWHLDAITLVFRPPRRPSHFQIKIRNVPDIPVRVLTW